MPVPIKPVAIEQRGCFLVLFAEAAAPDRTAALRQPTAQSLRLVLLSDAPVRVRSSVTGAMLIAALWPLYRSVRPRWVLRLMNGKLLYHDLISKRVTEVELASVTNVRVNKRPIFGVGAEGGNRFPE